MTTSTQTPKAEQMVAFFVQQLGSAFGRTALQKYLYLADYEARRYLGKPISDVEYIWYHHGPYDTELPNRIKALSEAGVIHEEPVEFPTGKSGYRYKLGSASVPYSFSAEEHAILQWVADQYAQLPLQNLLFDVVYTTEPMVEAQKAEAKNEPLKMDLVNGSRANELGVQLAQLLRSSQQVQTGETMSLEELRELLADRGGDAVAAA